MASILNSAFQYDKEARIFESNFEEPKGEFNHDLNSFRSENKSGHKVEINEDSKIVKKTSSQSHENP